MQGVSITNLSSTLHHRDREASGEEISSAIWILLFSVVSILSVCANIIFCVAVVCSRNTNKVYLFLIFCFFINIIEYLLLVVEFSLLPGSHYPYSELSCGVYQLAVQTCPLITGWALVVLVYRYSPVLCPPHLCWILLLPPLLLFTPILLFSGLAIYPSGDTYCVMDLAGLVAWLGMPMEKRELITALFNIIYTPLLCFIIPIFSLIAPLVKMNKIVITTMDDEISITLIMTIIISYGVFNLPYFTSIFIRHLLGVLSCSPSSRDKWLLDIFQSFFHLISYFFHVFRPMAAMVLDTNILTNFWRTRYKLIVYGEKNKDLDEL